MSLGLIFATVQGNSGAVPVRVFQVHRGHYSASIKYLRLWLCKSRKYWGPRAVSEQFQSSFRAVDCSVDGSYLLNSMKVVQGDYGLIINVYFGVSVCVSLHTQLHTGETTPFVKATTWFVTIKQKLIEGKSLVTFKWLNFELFNEAIHLRITANKTLWAFVAQHLCRFHAGHEGDSLFWSKKMKKHSSKFAW